MPLNEALFALLQSHFPPVKVINEGQERIVTITPDPSRPGSLLADVPQRGEQYAINCPFCGDARQRLFLSYRFGEHDSVTGRANYRLWICHNERCDQSPTNRAVLRSRLTIPLGWRGRPRPVAAAVTAASQAMAPPVPVEITLPSDLWPLGALPPSHPAIDYVVGRNFAPAYLSDWWGVCYCGMDQAARPAVYDRIVIPTYRPAVTFATGLAEQQLPPVLAGWQARAIGPLPVDAPRYLTAAGTQISKLLYGLPQALHVSSPVHVCEGVTDVWRLGPGAVALFGKTMSAHQKNLLVHHFPGRPIIVALDADARDDALQIVRQLQLARTGGPGDNRVLLLELPPGRSDIGECSFDEARAASLAALGQISRTAVAAASTK